MKLALVQYCHRGFAIKLADTVEELLQLDFTFNHNSSPPRIHRVDDSVCQDETGAALVREIEQQSERREFKVLRLP